MASRHAKDIDIAAFKELLEQYLGHIPSKLEELEQFRMQDLPSKLQERTESKQDLYLTKDELVKLVEWKLKHGTFRPKLLSLVQSNSDAEIQAATSSAFKAHLSKPDAYANANTVTSLKGIGIATGSLIMSSLDAQGAPFFGDELFRWIMWDEPLAGSNTGKGWDRKIAYNAKEYRRFVELVDVLRDRLDVPAIEVEQVGYVLGKLHANLSSTKIIDDGHKRKTIAPEPKVKAEASVKRQKINTVTSNTQETTRTTRSSAKKDGSN